MNHQKFCRHRARRPFGKTNRLSIIDMVKSVRDAGIQTSLHVEHAVADLLRQRARGMKRRAPRRLAGESQADHG